MEIPPNLNFDTALYRRQVLTIDSRNREGFAIDIQVWSPGVAYGAGAKVLVNSVGYVATAAHIANPVFAVDLIAGLWLPYNVSSPGSYKIKFPAIRNVKAARLITTEIPNSQYVINHKNRYLDVWDSALPAPGFATVPITMGTYTSTALADELNWRLNAMLGVGFGVAYTVGYLTTTQKYLITRLGGVNTFQFLFNTGPNGYQNTNMNPATVLGFANGSDLVAATSQMSSGIVNLAGENFAFLVIKGFNSVVTTTNIQDVFAKIIWNVIPRNVTFDSFAANSVVFKNNRDVVDELEVSFVEYNGQLYDFNNLDHSYSIEFLCEHAAFKNETKADESITAQQTTPIATMSTVDMMKEIDAVAEADSARYAVTVPVEQTTTTSEPAIMCGRCVPRR